MAEIKEEVIEELLDDEDRKKLAELDKKNANTKSDNLKDKERENRKMAKEKEKNSASAIRMAVAALVLALCTLGYCYYSIAMHNEKIDALLEQNSNMEYTLNDVKENEDAVTNRFKDVVVSKKVDANTNVLLNKSINVEVAPVFNYSANNYRYCNIPIRVTNVSAEKATYTVSFELTYNDKAGKPVVKNESIVVDELADGATREYAIFSSTDAECTNINNASLTLTKVVK